MKQLLFVETSKQKILETLFRFPEKEFTLSELATLGGVAKQNMTAIVKRLIQENLILVKRIGRIWRIRAYTDHKHFKNMKRIYNLYLLYESELLEEINKKYPHPRSVILFGSYGRGDDESTSDIDIAIELDKKQEYEIQKMKNKNLGKTIQIHLFHRTMIDKNLFSAIANGILLSGFLEVKT